MASCTAVASYHGQVVHTYLVLEELDVRVEHVPLRDVDAPQDCDHHPHPTARARGPQ